MGIKLEQEPDILDFITLSCYRYFFYTDAFVNVKNAMVRKILNLILSIIINLIVAILFILIIVAAIYSVYYLNFWKHSI